MFALLARFLLGAPPGVQAAVLGLSTGFFISALADANNRAPVLGVVVVHVVVVSLVAGAFFYAGSAADRRRAHAGSEAGPFVHAAYAVVWLVGLVAAVAALLGDGGVKVAVLAIIPLVLVAGPAFKGFGYFRHRTA
jgi:hypothetical protein